MSEDKISSKLHQQTLSDDLELKILAAAGELKVARIHDTYNHIFTAETHLGDALDALLELKKTLNLTTNLNKTE